MHLVLIDLIPALLSWEGRSPSDEPAVAEEAAHALGHLFDRFQIGGITDAGISVATLRTALEREGLDGYFDSIATSALYGPRLSGRVLRRLVRAIAAGERPIVVTGRKSLADDLAGQRFPTVLTTQEEFGAVPEAVFSIADGRVNP